MPLYEERLGAPLSDTAKTMIAECMDELKSRAKTLVQIVDESEFFAAENPTPDEKAEGILNSDDAKMTLNEIPAYLENLDVWTTENIMQSCKDFAKEKLGGKLGKVGMPMRAKITGRTASPGIFHVCEILGKEETLKRLKV